jgi:hypothetical protein
VRSWRLSKSKSFYIVGNAAGVIIRPVIPPLLAWIRPHGSAHRVVEIAPLASHQVGDAPAAPETTNQQAAAEMLIVLPLRQLVNKLVLLPSWGYWGWKLACIDKLCFFFFHYFVAVVEGIALLNLLTEASNLRRGAG